MVDGWSTSFHIGPILGPPGRASPRSHGSPAGVSSSRDCESRGFRLRPLGAPGPAGYGHPMGSAAAARSKPTLSPAVVAWRGTHGLIAIGFLASIGYVWWCALTGRRGPLLGPAIVALVSEGALVVVNRGDCPLGPLGDRIGDPVPLFELVLSPRAARRAVPTLGALTLVGLGLLAARSRSGLAPRVPAVRSAPQTGPDARLGRRVEANGE